MAEHTYTFDVTMSCGGCKGAVDRVLGKLDGVKSHDVSLEKQQATVQADDTASFETVLETIKKTGKKVTGAKKDGESVTVE
ncbi:MAG: Cytosolic copper metallochaperone [Vezdaea aestivalis]|nr:MAG: Cytosolic copper metallochaperone [Vezdaea aestivalis]